MIHQKYPDDVAVMPVFTYDKPNIMKPYFEKHQFSMSPLRASPYVDSVLYGLLGTPLTYIVDRRGRIVDHISGFPRDTSLEKLPEEFDVMKRVESLLEE